MKKLFIKLSSIIATLVLCFSTTVFGLGSSEAFAETSGDVASYTPTTLPYYSLWLVNDVPPLTEVTFPVECIVNSGKHNITIENIGDEKGSYTVSVCAAYNSGDKVINNETSDQNVLTIPVDLGDKNLFNMLKVKIRNEDTAEKQTFAGMLTVDVKDKDVKELPAYCRRILDSAASTLKVGLSAILALLGGMFFLS